MQINAINTQSFKGSAYAAENERPVTMDPNFNKQLEVLDKIADKANSDVHPSTVIATVIAVATAAVSVHKLVPYARRFAVKAGEAISQGATKAFAAIANKFKKNKIDVSETLQNISSKATKLIEGNPDSKLPKKIGDFFGPVLGKSSEEVQEFVTTKIGVKNGAEAFDALAAVAAGALTLDPVSDKVEEHNDAKDIVDGIAEML